VDKFDYSQLGYFLEKNPIVVSIYFFKDNAF